MRLVPLALAVVLCAAPAAARETADLIRIEKAERRMTLYADDVPLRVYRVALGFAPAGDKERQGDGRTPEGRYTIDFKNPNSAFHLSLRISYPSRADRAEARARGVDPGGDIFIHGTPGLWSWTGSLHTARDWTLGCVAVTNAEIEEIWRLVDVGTRVEIVP